LQIINKTLNRYWKGYCTGELGEATETQSSLNPKRFPVIEGKVKKHKGTILGVYPGIQGDRRLRNSIQKHKSKGRLW